VGKTALATAVAATVNREEFADGVAVVWLAPLRSAELVAAEVAVAIGLTRSGGLSYEDALTRWLVDKDILLVLDNCEHLVSAVADLVDSLTSQLPRLRILATSREPLWVDGEISHRLSPLALAGLHASLEEIGASPAVQLFRERAGARQEESLKTARACRAIGEICRRVDGLPLAIELAAARATGLDLEDITSHLDDLFNLLPRQARRADGGQRSLRATVEWSDALLTQEERGFLHRMAVFAGGFDLAAIKGICATERESAAQVADLTARLVEKSLLMKLGDGGRYQLLETIRQYSIEQLGAAGELDTVRDRHARFYLEAALRECAGLTTGPERPHIEALGCIGDNLRVALERLLEIAPRAALELAAGLTIFWWTQGKLREGIGWLEQAREAAPDAPAELLAAGLFSEGFLVAHDTDDWFAAAKLIDAGIDAVASAVEPPPILGMLHCLRGECDVFNGDAKSAVVRTQTGLAMMSAYPGTWGRGFSLWNAAYARRAAGDVDAAIALMTEEIDLTRQRGYGIAEMCGCNVMGEIWETRADLEKSRAFWERALRLRQEIGASRIGHVHGTMATSLLAIARVASKQGDLATASKFLREALPIAEEMRDGATAQQIVELLMQTSRVEPTQSATLRPEGGVWHVEFNGKSVHVPDFKGLWHLRELVSRPREPVLALSLIAAKSEEPLPVSDAGPQLDREALRQYRKRLGELDDELEEAEAHNDVARHAKRSAEREALLRELARATGLGGRPRRTGSPTEKARLNVTRTLRHAIAYLATTVPELGAHMDESLVTGVSCCYEPRVNVSWTT
jgi:predicted ATPase